MIFKILLPFTNRVILVARPKTTNRPFLVPLSVIYKVVEWKGRLYWSALSIVCSISVSEALRPPKLRKEMHQQLETLTPLSKVIYTYVESK